MGLSLLTTRRYGECKGCNQRFYTADEVEQHAKVCEPLRKLEAEGKAGWRTGQESESRILSL